MIETVMRFGSPIWRAEAELPRNAYEWAVEYKEDNPITKPQVRSSRGGYQSLPRTFDYLPPLYRQHITEISEVLLGGKKFKLGNWWLNVNQKGDFNMRHTHPMSDISGIWYLTDNHNTLTFEDPMSHSRYPLYKNFPELVGAGVFVNAKAGEILLFPADLPHYVNPHPEDSLRISVSFNMDLIY